MHSGPQSLVQSRSQEGERRGSAWACETKAFVMRLPGRRQCRTRIISYFSQKTVNKITDIITFRLIESGASNTNMINTGLWKPPQQVGYSRVHLIWLGPPLTSFLASSFPVMGMTNLSLVRCKNGRRPCDSAFLGFHNHNCNYNTPAMIHSCSRQWSIRIILPWIVN